MFERRTMGFSPLGFLGGLHFPLVLLTLLLGGAGLMMLYSAANGSWQPWAEPQAMRFGVGIGLMFFLAAFPQRWIYSLTPLGYVAIIGLLVLVEIFGHTGMGAQRWLKIGGVTLQPSEPMKLALILMLARYYHRLNTDMEKKLWTLLVPGVIIAIPVMLVLMQPNLGTASLLAGIALAILFAAGVPWWLYAVGIGGMLVSLPLIYEYGLKDYQKLRVMTFMNPESDPLGSGYNIMQSKIAIGSGGMSGKGYMQGSQSQLDFLPEKHTDFVFTMLVEEFGFLGGVTLLAGFVLLLAFAYRFSLLVHNHFARLACIGIATYFFLHLFINTAMVMGMIPVVGVPLPFLSYGGTALMTNCLAVGLLLNFYRNRKSDLPRSGGL